MLENAGGGDKLHRVLFRQLHKSYQQEEQREKLLELRRGWSVPPFRYIPAPPARYIRLFPKRVHSFGPEVDALDDSARGKKAIRGY